MTATGHAIIGASIAARVTNPVVAYPLILTSHFLADKVPHWDPMTNRKNKTMRKIVIESVIDVLFGFTIVYLIFVKMLHGSPVNVFAAAIVAQLPDWLEIPYSFFRKKIEPFYSLYRAQKWIHDFGFNSRADAPWGVITQVVTAIIFIFISLKK